jgi:hypothetical protein
MNGNGTKTKDVTRPVGEQMNVADGVCGRFREDARDAELQ